MFCLNKVVLGKEKEKERFCPSLREKVPGIPPLSPELEPEASSRSMRDGHGTSHTPQAEWALREAGRERVPEEFQKCK